MYSWVVTFRPGFFSSFAQSNRAKEYDTIATMRMYLTQQNSKTAEADRSIAFYLLMHVSMCNLDRPFVQDVPLM